MPRAPSSGLSLLLLMAGLALAATLPPHIVVNPWLSETDLQHASAAAAAACLPPNNKPPLCPPPCPANSTKSTQCLYYLQKSHKEEVCGQDVGPERRRQLLHGLRMQHCCEHAVTAALPDAAFHAATTCRHHLDALLQLDDLARRVSCGHADLLTRYDCGQTYSIAHHCNHCKEAYRRWVCSSLVPHYTRGGDRMRPCLSVCQDVEQQCPYLLPGDWTNQTVQPGETVHPTPQYAGEPTFICLDPNIPETEEQRARSLRGDEDCCYTHCGSSGRGGTASDYGEDPRRSSPSSSSLPSSSTSSSSSASLLAVQKGGGQPQQQGLCEHCPGRPSTSKRKKKDDSPVPSSATLSSSAVVRNRAAGRTFTINKVLILWTAWISIFLEHSHTISHTLKCLLVWCAMQHSVWWTTLLTFIQHKTNFFFKFNWNSNWRQSCS